ncbi:hypothetical protein V6615_05200 [Oscillospiraceae bacterium PP1C4]
MDNNELFAQVLAAMQNQTETLTQMMEKKIGESETRINIKIENEVTKRIDALFDGYKLTHEKQWEMERKMQELEQRLERIESLQSAG